MRATRLHHVTGAKSRCSGQVKYGCSVNTADNYRHGRQRRVRKREEVKHVYREI